MATSRKRLFLTLFFCIFSSLYAGISVREKEHMNRWVDGVMLTLTPKWHN